MRMPYDLSEFVRLVKRCPADMRAAFVPAYEQMLSKESTPLKYKEHELNDLSSLVTGFIDCGLDESCLDGFVFSYHIPRISCEFDLLKIGESSIIDIELKSQRVGDEKLIRQMRRNAYYLSFLGKETCAICYVSSDDEWYELEDDRLRQMSWDEACSKLAAVRAHEPTDYDALFIPSRYLVSPIVNYERFAAGEYFLSDQQEDAKKRVMACSGSDCSGGVVVVGGAGTGKTLLLFDVAKSVARKTGKRAAIFYGARLSDPHQSFNEKSDEIVILHAKRLQDADVTRYGFVGFDEAHRMYPKQFEAAMGRVKAAGLPFMVTLDSRQSMSRQEDASAVEEIAKGLVPSERYYNLGKKFRTNKVVADFVEAFVFGRRLHLSSAEGIDVVFAESEAEAKAQANRFRESGYQLIAMSPSKSKGSFLNTLLLDGCPSTHNVIGLEYDKVVMIVSHVSMRDSKLCDEGYPDPNLMPTRLLYQGLTRARDAIALVVLSDWDVYQRAVELIATAYREY